MEKLSSILAVVPDAAASAIVIEKASILARRFGASIELLLADPAESHALAARSAALGIDCVASPSSAEIGLPLTERIVRRLRERPADLVIKNFSQRRPRHRFELGAADTALALDCPVPLLLVRNKPWAKDLHMAAALDAAERDGEALARGILHAAGLLAMRCGAALDVIYSEREKDDERVRMERAVRLARIVREFHVGRERLQMLEGPPEGTLPAFVAAQSYDLIAVGASTHRAPLFSRRRALTHLLVEHTTSDVLFVNETVPAVAECEADDCAAHDEDAARSIAHP